MESIKSELYFKPRYYHTEYIHIKILTNEMAPQLRILQLPNIVYLALFLYEI